MYNIDSKIKCFYRNKVVLSQSDQQNLREKKDINIQRLVYGLKDYNISNNTSYELNDNVVQGSMAMYTVTQNDEKNYDIDVAVVFDKDDLPSGNIATKNIVVNALKSKCKQFNTEPEFKTNCVRIQYADGYHIDFAIYRKSTNFWGEDVYEHCGSEWRNRNPWGITQWFTDKNQSKNKRLRVFVRMLKMFAKSRIHWNMPGGLLLTVLANEVFVDYERYDELFYYNMIAIRDRLSYNKEIYNPTDSSQNLLLKESDNIKVENLSTRLTGYIEKLDVLFNDSCNENEALHAWNDIFSHSYFSNLIQEQQNYQKTANLHESSYWQENSEEFIEDLFPIHGSNYLEIECDIKKEGSKTVYKLSNMLKKSQTVPTGMKLHFYISKVNVNKPYEVVWKVKNDCSYTGDLAQQRGELFTTEHNTFNDESSDFYGNHSVECYIIKDNKCVAFDKLDVPIF